MRRPSPKNQLRGNDNINNNTTTTTTAATNRRGSFTVYAAAAVAGGGGGFPTQRHIMLLALFLVLCSLCQICFVAVTIPSYYHHTLLPSNHNNDMPILKVDSFTTSSHQLLPESSLKHDYHHHYNINRNDKPTTTTTNSTELHSDSNTNNDNEIRNHRRNQHMIPRNLLFTHYKNLLLRNNNNNNESQDFTEEERVLSQNVYNTIQISNPSNVYFFTDVDCIQSLERVFPSLIPHFQNETQGMYKADICRGSTLYENGGFYFDVDVGVRHDPWEDLLPQTEFVTSKVHKQSHFPNHFFQAILGSSPKSTIMYKYLELFYNHYTGRDVVMKGPLGVILLRRAWDQIYDANMNQPSTEIYSEILYNSKLFPDLYPPPTWGIRRACHFVVVAKVNYPESKNHTEFIYHNNNNNNDLHYRIPFYSRIAGSRICPITPPAENNDNNKTMDGVTTVTENQKEQKKQS